MKTLLVNLCSDTLSELEFIWPIKKIVENIGFKASVKHYATVTSETVKSAEKIIICGTALKDDAFLGGIERFEWLREVNKPVLAIGSSFLLTAQIFGDKIIEKPKIGVFKVNIVKKNNLTEKRKFYAYFLTKKIVHASGFLETLAKAGAVDCMVKHAGKEIYACLFHPEVTSQEIISNFLLKVQSPNNHN